jgi:UDP-glucose 4-epimerase
MAGRVLVTGGAGFIGSHTIYHLLKAGYSCTVVDNLCNSSQKSLDRVRSIMEDEGVKEVDLDLMEVDMCDSKALETVFEKYGAGGFTCCIHFAGLKAVGESMQVPLLYYQNNLGSTLNLLELMDKYDCRRIVFSSSATVYGAATTMPITEDTPTGAGITNAYGRTKYMIEGILGDFHKSKVKVRGWERRGEEGREGGREERSDDFFKWRHFLNCNLLRESLRTLLRSFELNPLSCPLEHRLRSPGAW